MAPAPPPVAPAPAAVAAPVPAPAIAPKAPTAPQATPGRAIGPTRTKIGVGDDAATRATDPGAAPEPREQRRGTDYAWSKQFAAKLEAELGADPEPLREARLHYELGRLLEAQGNASGAAEHLHRAHILRPEHVPTMRAARRVALGRKKFQEALPLFDAEARVTSDPKRKALLLYEKGRLLEEKIAKKGDARSAYEAALELDHGNPTIFKAVQRAETAAAAWNELDKTFEAQANAVAADPKHRAAVVTERARLVETRKNDPQMAAELFQSALGLDEHAPGALHALKRLFYAHGRWSDLIGILELEARQATDPTVRAMALYRVARISVDRVGSVDQGLGAMQRAVQETPDDPMLLEELARLCEVSEKWAELAGILERLVARTEAANQRVGLFHRLGLLFEEKLEEQDRALEWFGRALEVDAAYAPALQALGALYTRRKQWAPLLAMHLGEARATKNTKRRAAAYGRVAEIQETQLGDTDGAMKQHARALAILPGYAPSFKALERLYAAAGHHRELIDLYEREIEATTSKDAQITTLFKIGRIQEDSLSDPSLAVGTFHRIIELDGDHLGAIHAVQRSAERAHRWKDLIAALELETRKITDAGTIVSLVHRAGEICELHLDDDEGALSRYRRVLDRDPKYAPALTSIGRLYFKAGRWEDLLETYRLELDILERGPESAALLYKMGELSEDRLGRDDDAIDYYRKAIDVDPFHTPSLHALGRLLHSKEKWAELVKLLELELSSVKDPAARARTAFRMGEAYENRLKEPDKALAAYEQSLGAVSDFRPARDGRARLLAQSRDYRTLADELEREASTATDPAIVIAALLHQGEIWRDQLKEPRKAIHCFDEVLKRDQKHLGALLALETLYAEVGAWEPLGQLYSLQSRVLGDPGARIAALRELARMEDNRDGRNLETLKQAHFAILQLAPTDPIALASLEQIAIETGDADLLAHVDAALAGSVEDPMLASAHHTRLAEALEARGDATALDRHRTALSTDPENLAATSGFTRLARVSGDAALLEEAAGFEARIGRDREAAAALLVEAASLRVAAGDSGGASSALERALDLHPDDQTAAERLRSLLVGSQQFDKLLDVLGRAARTARLPDRRAAHSVAMAEIFADEKNDVSTAITTLNRVANELPGHAPTLTKLAELYARDGHWSEAVDRFGQVLTLSPSPEVYVGAHLKLAEMLDEHLGDPARAISSLEAVLKVDASHRDALKRLLGIQIRRGAEREAAETAARLVGVSADPSERADALTHLAKLERALGRKDRAAQAYREAVTLAGLSGSAGQEFKDLLAEQKRQRENPDWAAYVDALNGYLAQPASRASAAVFLELARVLDDEMSVSDRALATLQQGLSAMPENSELRMDLAERLKKAGHLPQAADELRRLLDVSVTRPETWRDLAACFTGLGREAEATFAMAGLVALGAANDLEQATVSARPVRPAAAGAGAFDAGSMRLIEVAEEGDDAAARLLGSLSEGLGKIHPAEFEQYGLTSRDKISSRSANPLRTLADRVAQAFGVTDFDLYVHRAHTGSVEVEVTSPPSILVPAQVTTYTESQQVFLLARVLANVARGVQAIDKLQPPDVELLLAAAARNVDPAFGAGLAHEEYLMTHQKKVNKSVAWLSRKSVDEAASGYVAVPRVDAAAWADRVKTSAARAALLLSDDLPGSIDIVRRTEGDLAGLEGAVLAQGMALVSNLMQFWISDTALTLRRRVGLM